MNNSLVSLQSMSTRKNKGDSGLIAEEIIAAAESDTIQRCRVVEMSVKDGDFSLPEALRVYNVSKADYNNYTRSKNQYNKQQIQTGELSGGSTDTITADAINTLTTALATVIKIAVAQPEIAKKFLDMMSDAQKKKHSTAKKGEKV